MKLSNLKKLRKHLVLFVAGGVLLPPSLVNAASITGTVELSGAFTPINSGGGTATLGAATGIDFKNNLATVVDSSGDLAALTPISTTATMTDFQFNPLSPSPVTVWSAGIFAFSLESVAITTQNSTALVLNGSGTLTGTGFDPTPGTWVLTGQTASGVTFSWSSSNAVVPVPPAVWLFGSGLVGMAGIARRNKVA
jgi:hypothetical protein